MIRVAAISREVYGYLNSVTPDSHLGNISDIFHHNNNNNQLER